MILDSFSFPQNQANIILTRNLLRYFILREFYSLLQIYDMTAKIYLYIL